jgi:hypothetical protein
MLQLVYISTARHQFSDEELESVLWISRRNNMPVGVTGLLVAGGRRFLQALEGPEDAVIRTFERIKADPRHFAVVPLSKKIIEARQFGAWAMAFEPGAAGTALGLRDIVDELVTTMRDKNLAAQFTGFAEIHARAA